MYDPVNGQSYYPEFNIDSVIIELNSRIKYKDLLKNMQNNSKYVRTYSSKYALQ